MMSSPVGSYLQIGGVFPALLKGFIFAQLLFASGSQARSRYKKLNIYDEICQSGTTNHIVGQTEFKMSIFKLNEAEYDYLLPKSCKSERNKTCIAEFHKHHKAEHCYASVSTSCKRDMLNYIQDPYSMVIYKFIYDRMMDHDFLMKVNFELSRNMLMVCEGLLRVNNITITKDYIEQECSLSINKIMRRNLFVINATFANFVGIDTPYTFAANTIYKLVSQFNDKKLNIKYVSIKWQNTDHVFVLLNSDIPDGLYNRNNPIPNNINKKTYLCDKWLNNLGVKKILFSDAEIKIETVPDIIGKHMVTIAKAGDLSTNGTAIYWLEQQIANKFYEEAISLRNTALLYMVTVVAATIFLCKALRR